MASDNYEEIQARIKKEEIRLLKIYKKIEARRKNTIAGLIQRAAFMRVSLEDLELDINIYGFTELFSQGDQEPYQRERPAAKIYGNMNSNYQKIIKQLTDLLPKAGDVLESADGFDRF